MNLSNLYKKFCLLFIAIATFAAISCDLINYGYTGPTTEEGDSVEGLYVRPASEGEISITPEVDSDIWYVFTNTSTDKIDKPKWYLPSAANNLLSAKVQYSFSCNNGIQPEAIRIDSDAYAKYKGPADYDKGISSASVKTRDGGGSSHNDVVGGTAEFYDHTRSFVATCKLIRTVDTVFGPRTLIIYEENGMTTKTGTIPSSQDYTKIANAFLKEGLDNDIFDKLTGVFGCDWGEFNGKNHPQLLTKDDKITLLYCNIDKAGDPTGQYVGGYYTGLHYETENPYSNKRMMVTLHAHASGGELLGDGLTTLAHEFQHLLHDQYLNYNLYRWGVTKFGESSSSMTEMFSSIAETLTAQFISESCDVEVPGPFCVGSDKNPNGYVKYTSNSDLTEGAVKKVAYAGRGGHYLKAMDYMDFMNWGGELEDYGLVASLGAYLLINYGTEIFLQYINGDRADVAGIVDAINAIYDDAEMTEDKLISNWGVAVMMSKVPNTPIPHTFNKEGWFFIGGLKVPSINFYNYFNKIIVGNNTTAFDISNYGIMDRTIKENQAHLSKQFVPRAVNPYKVKGNVGAGSTFEATAPVLPQGLRLTVIAVPK